MYQIASVMRETSTWVLMYQLSLSLLIEDQSKESTCLGNLFNWSSSAAAAAWQKHITTAFISSVFEPIAVSS